MWIANEDKELYKRVEALDATCQGLLTATELRETPLEVTSSALTDAQLRALPVGVQASSLPLPTGAATEVTLQGILDKLLSATSNLATATSLALTTQPLPSKKWKWSFAKGVSGGIDTDFATLRQVGPGMAVNQVNGNLTITTGTTAYSETVIRSNNTFKGTGVIQYALTLSQRIANQNFVVEWCDVIGDNLSFTVNSATSVTVTKVNHGFTSGDIGKGLWLGEFTLAGCLTQRGVIASVTTDTITFTVTGFPNLGSGTCSVYGLNYYQVIYNGTSVTNLGTGVTTQRLGWQNSPVNAAINSTTSGHIGIFDSSRCVDASYLDQVISTSTSVMATAKASFNANIPDADTELYLQIRIFNGSTAPATSTTATFGFINAEMYNPQMVNISGVQAFGYKNAGPVYVTNTINGNMTMVNAGPTIYADSTTVLAANAAFTGTARDAGSTNTQRYFTATVFSDQAGAIFRIEQSNDNVTWRRATADTATVANTPLTIRTDVVARYYRVYFMNGATLQTQFMLNSAFHRN